MHPVLPMAREGEGYAKERLLNLESVGDAAPPRCTGAARGAECSSECVFIEAFLSMGADCI